MLSADPRLANLRALAPNVEWMNGMQFYLRRDAADSARARHSHRYRMGADQHLAGSSSGAACRRPNSATATCAASLSVDVSDWTTAGSNGRPAMQCSREEVVRETWRQLKRSINVEQELLRDEDLHSWFLDPDIRERSRPSADFYRIWSRCW